jgi:polyisoprenoid-binding protein YceI
MTTAVSSTIPGLVAGVWTIDPTHSEVSFTVRHLMVSKVRGTFRSFSGDVTVTENLLDSQVRATVDINSIDTREENRDNHLRSADFFEAEKYPEMTFASTAIRPDGDDFVLVGPDAYGGTRAGFSADTEISRADFGVDIHMPLDGGGVVVGDKVKIVLEIQAVLQA